ncbi:MAG TPA: division/cell wall cluster transcriptional repressor MraZ [bacterium]
MKKDTGSFLHSDPTKPLYTKIMARSHQCHCDPQGRLVVPKSHLDMAKITNKVKIVGLQDTIQLWNPDLFEKYIESA